MMMFTEQEFLVEEDPLSGPKLTFMVSKTFLFHTHIYCLYILSANTFPKLHSKHDLI